MNFIPVEGERNVACMGLLLSMKGCVNIVAPNQDDNAMAELEALNQEMTQLTVQLRNLPETFEDNDDQFGVLRDASGRLAWVKYRLQELERGVINRQNVIGRVVGNFERHLVDAAVLEVDDVWTADIALYLRQTCGWRGIACYAQELNVVVQNQIRDTLGNAVPVRLKITQDNGHIVLVPPPVQVN